MKRFTVVNEGYNMEEVNRFIDIVIKRLEKLNNENAMLQTKISSLEEKLKEEKAEKQSSTLQLEIHSMYRAYFHQPESFFYEQDAEFILHYLQTEFPKQEFLQRIEMLSELLCYDASIKSSAKEKKELYRKALYTMEYLDTHSDTFSFERRRKIGEIKAEVDE